MLDWANELTHRDTEQSLIFFKHKVLEQVDEHVPLRKEKPKSVKLHG